MHKSNNNSLIVIDRAKISFDNSSLTHIHSDTMLIVYPTHKHIHTYVMLID